MNFPSHICHFWGILASQTVCVVSAESRRTSTESSRHFPRFIRRAQGEEKESNLMNWLRSVLEFLYDMLFGCRHERLTRPFTLEQQTYKVCLDCGRHVFYSAERMEPLTAREVRRMRKSDAGE